MAFKLTEQNRSALQPLFQPWEQPNRHRLPNPDPDQPAIIAPGRRPSKVPLVNAIRAQVDVWRAAGYPGISETSRTLLNHWFSSEHLITLSNGELQPFRYHWAQREAIETIIYLYELRRVRSVAELLFEFGDQSLAEQALGIPADDDRWARYCAKVATGAGKTKIMSLAIVWSYFHSLYEPNSDLPRHFVVIAPNLTVYERLKDDFEGGAIFYRDPLIPDAWRGDFQMQVVLQDEPGGTLGQGAIYLTNIHRLYPKPDDRAKPGKRKQQASAYDPALIFGPQVSRSQALEAGETLRARIAAHPSLMVLNDEAHHVHDPDLAWSQAIRDLHMRSLARGSRGVCLQLDFSATPKHNDGKFFRHIVVDFPLGEAVDAGIVKVPVLGESDDLVIYGDKHTPAHERYTAHLKLGYARYAAAFEELSAVRKPVLFVMTEDAQAANEIAEYLDSEAFPLLKGRVLNIHTRLKGKVKEVIRGGRKVKEFIEDEGDIKPEDLRALREMSRELDSPESKYRCVVSVMMLREGWDVRNVTTIVPLRPYSAKSGILPEQTLGRGLRRMFPPGEALETVTVIEHPAFRALYDQELSQEGVEIAVMPAGEAYKQTVTIFVDRDRKPVDALDIAIPLVSDAIEVTSELQGLTFEEVRAAFQQRGLKPLPIGQPRNTTVEYEERHLFTNEVIAKMALDPGLLARAWSAPAYFAQMLGRVCQVNNSHAVLAPLIERFICEVLFERPVSLYSGEVDHRMRDMDVVEHIRAVFTRLILDKTVHRRERRQLSQAQPLSRWKPYQATSHAKRPAIQAKRTIFNLVPCENDFERAFVAFLDQAGDVAAFAKNAGPQKLMIDYLKPDGQRGLYAPDFFARAADGTHYLIELKGRQDNLVPLKARAAAEWCRAASEAGGARWEYLYVLYEHFQPGAAETIAELARACAPALDALLAERIAPPEPTDEVDVRQWLTQAGLDQPPAEYEAVIRQAVTLLEDQIRQAAPTLGAAFQPLLGPLDDYAQRILEQQIKPAIPAQDHERFFQPSLDHLSKAERAALEKNQRHLFSILVENRPVQRLGTLLFCLGYAQRGAAAAAGGVWQAVRQRFSAPAFQALYGLLDQVNQFRNRYIAHVEQPLRDADEARAALRTWLACLNQMAQIT
jgi:type III restriction enzyme